MSSAAVSQAAKAASGAPHIPPLATVSQFAEKHPAFTEGQIRWVLFNSETNGLNKSGAIVRFGRRILLNEEKFFAWLLSGHGKRTDQQRAA